MIAAELGALRFGSDLGQVDSRDLYFALERLGADYAQALDEDELERWAGLFTEDAIYKVIPRENFEANLPIAVMYCASRGMMEDRIKHIRETAMFAPRRYRHITGTMRITKRAPDCVHAQSNYAVFETTFDQKTQIYNVGKYVDRVVAQDGALKLAQRLCVFDSSVIPTSLIYPI